MQKYCHALTLNILWTLYYSLRLPGLRNLATAVQVSIDAAMQHCEVNNSALVVAVNANARCWYGGARLTWLSTEHS